MPVFQSQTLAKAQLLLIEPVLPGGDGQEDYVRTARAKGLHEYMVLGRHALKNALLPVVTITGHQLAGLLGRVIIIEFIFVVPGVGSWTIRSIYNHDYTVLQGVIFLGAVVILTVNLVIDLLYGVLDRRKRLS